MSQLPDFLEKAKATYNFHRKKIMEDASWTIEKTARILRRSKGGVSEDLKIAKWSKNLPQIERLSYAYEALKLIRDYEKQSNWDELE